MTSRYRYYILTEIEGCKREEIRNTMKRSLKQLAIGYLIVALFCLLFGCFAMTDMANPDLTEVELAKMSAMLITAGIFTVLLLSVIVDCMYSIWREPTEKEIEEFGDRIV